MTQRTIADPLRQGLRALTLLAQHGPLDLAGFAEASDLRLHQAEALIELFEANGLARGLAEDGVFAATSLANELIGPICAQCSTLH